MSKKQGCGSTKYSSKERICAFCGNKIVRQYTENLSEEKMSKTSVNATLLGWRRGHQPCRWTVLGPEGKVY